MMVKTTTTPAGGTATTTTETLNFSYDASGVPLAVDYNGTDYYYVANIQGDIMAILSTSGSAVVSYTYDAWGKLYATTGTLADTLGGANPLTYRGYVYDHDSGYYYLQSRYYAPEVGRFINADALVATGQGLLGNNMFSYCNNNAVLFSDDTGNSPWPTTKVLKDGCGGTSSIGGSNYDTIPGIPINFEAILEAAKDAIAAIGSLAAAIAESQRTSTIRGPHCVYVLIDSDKTVQYVGRTQNPVARENAHKRNPFRKALTFMIVAENLSYEQARGLEQALMLFFHTLNTANKMNNQIWGISVNNENIDDYLIAAEGALGYTWNWVSNEVMNWLGL